MAEIEDNSEDQPSEINQEISETTEETPTETENLQPNEMEVHHHGHVHENKKWKEYVFQFFMLFLAVFCGSLAEYQLEHKIENDREKVYIESMVEDLKKDTTNLAFCIRGYKQLELRMDTVLALYPKLAIGYNPTLRRNIEGIKGYPDFIYTDRTIKQLKNSGSMRLIRNKEVADAIISYDSEVFDLIEIDVSDMHFTFLNMYEEGYGLFDNDGLETDLKTESLSELEKGTKNYLLKSDKEALGRYNNRLRDIKSLYKMVLPKEIILKEKAVKLIELLKKEYHLE